MKAIQIISQDVFDKVRSRFQNLEMGDETGAVTLDPSAARFFDFDFIYEGVNLGRISISLADLGSLKIYYSKGITEDQDDVSKQMWYDFLREMRMFAMRRLLRFDTRDIAKTNLDKNDFQHLAATQTPKDDEEMKNTMTESRWTGRNTKKTSRAVKGKTEIIVRHTESMEGVHPSLRSNRKKIKGIYIQNHLGERFKYPFEHLDGALAMGMHVEHGGVPYDAAGKAIIGMSEEIAKLQEFQKLVHSSTLHDDANQIKERAVGRLNHLKAHIKSLSKRHHYESWIAEFNEQEYMDNDLNMDDVTMEQYKEKFTQTNFQEELAGYFPLLHKIMKEANKIDLEEYVNESDSNSVIQIDGKEVDPSTLRVDGVHRWDYPEFTDAFFEYGEFTDGTELTDNQLDRLANEYGDLLNQMAADSLHESGPNEFSQFEDWAEAMVEGELTADQLTAFKNELSRMQQSGEKLDFDTAVDFFAQFGIDDDQLAKDLEAQKGLNANVDPLATFRDWAKDAYPDLIRELGDLLPKEQQAQPEPQAQPGAEVAPPQPQPTAENDEAPSKPEFENENMIETVARLIKSRYNAYNENVGPFRGHEGILIDVKKEVSEKFGEAAGLKAEMIAEKFMQKLEAEWMKRHGQHSSRKEDQAAFEDIMRLAGLAK